MSDCQAKVRVIPWRPLHVMLRGLFGSRPKLLWVIVEVCNQTLLFHLASFEGPRLGHVWGGSKLGVASGDAFVYRLPGLLDGR